MTQQPNVQQQGVQQPQMVRQSTFGMMHPHQAPVMMRMPMGDEATHYQQQFRQFTVLYSSISFYFEGK